MLVDERPENISHLHRQGTQHEKGFSLLGLSAPRERVITPHAVTADCSARRRSPTQTTPLLLPCHRHRHHRRRPLHLCHRRRSRSVGRSVAVVGAAFTIAVRPPSDGPTDTAHPSFQVVEVELVAHLPTDWEKRGRGATRFKGPLSLSLSLSISLSGQETK